MTGRVLVLDDDVDGATVIAEVLRRWSFDVVVVHSASAALEALQTGRFEAALCDDLLGGELSGRDVLAFAARAQPQMLRVLATAFELEACDEAHAILHKPFTLYALCNVLVGKRVRERRNDDATPDRGGK